MSPLQLPFSPRFISLTLAVVATLLFGAWLYFDQRSIVLAVLLGIFVARPRPRTAPPQAIEGAEPPKPVAPST